MLAALRADAKEGQWMSRVMELLCWRVQSDPEKTTQFSMHSVLSLTVLRLHVVHCSLRLGQAELKASCSC